MAAGTRPCHCKARCILKARSHAPIVLLGAGICGSNAACNDDIHGIRRYLYALLLQLLKTNRLLYLKLQITPL